MAIGVFGIGEILVNAAKPPEQLEQQVIVPRLRDLFPTLQDLKRAIGAILRGTGIGFGVGLIPGAGAGDRDLCLLHRWRSGSRSTRRNSARARSRASPGRSPPTMPPRSRRSSRCSCSASRSARCTAILLGALLIHGVTPGAAADQREPAALLGGGREHVHRQLHPAAAQPAVRAAVRQHPARAEEDPAAADHALLHHRHVQRQQLGRSTSG